jgi:hypothetical protein
MSNDKRAATVKNVVEVEVSSNVCSFLEYMGYKYVMCESESESERG